jgi:ATP-binding cassette subfamily B protein
VGLLSADLLCASLMSAVTLILPLIANHITKNLLGTSRPQDLHDIYFMGGCMLALVSLYAICNHFVDYRGHQMGAWMERDMRRDLFMHLQKQPFSFFDRHRTGELMSRITNDLLEVSELLHHGPEDLTIGIIRSVGVFAILACIDLHLTFILFLFLPFMTAYAFYFSAKMNLALAKSKARIADINAQVEDTLLGIRVVQSFTNEAIESQKFAFENERFIKARSEGYRSEANLSTGFAVFTELMSVAIIVFGAVAISKGTLDLADLVTYLLCVAILVEPIQRFVNFARLYQEGISSFTRFMELMEIKPAIINSENALELTHIEGDIQFKNVTFKYQDDGEHVLKDLSLHVRPREFIALVGSSGVGKTTLCNLIPRFYEIERGEILIDGQNIRDVSLPSLRKLIGVVEQDIYLFSGNVADNIRYGKPGASPEEIIEAAKQANAHHFIMSLPNGYDTYIGQRGVMLSGGQKQRLSIARVFLKNPPILIFDEATSALDSESERAIQSSIEKLTQSRTTIVIAHRLSTIKHAQRIIVLAEGGIVEQGTHEDLLSKNGPYAKLYRTSSHTDFVPV